MMFSIGCSAEETQPKTEEPVRTKGEEVDWGFEAKAKKRRRQDSNLRGQAQQISSLSP